MLKVSRIFCLIVLPVVAAYAQTQPVQSTRKDAQPSQSEMLTRGQVIGIIDESRKIVSPNGVEVLTAVPIGGTMQWVSVRWA
jgi:hypothetical protein